MPGGSYAQKGQPQEPSLGPTLTRCGTRTAFPRGDEVAFTLANAYRVTTAVRNYDLIPQHILDESGAISRPAPGVRSSDRCRLLAHDLHERLFGSFLLLLQLFPPLLSPRETALPTLFLRQLRQHIPAVSGRIRHSRDASSGAGASVKRRSRQGGPQVRARPRGEPSVAV
jgi:hypothetical protein